MENNTVVLELKEYNRLRDIDEALKKNEKTIIYYSYHNSDTYYFLNIDETNLKLIDIIKNNEIEYDKKLNLLWDELQVLRRLKNNLKNISQTKPNKPWYKF